MQKDLSEQLKLCTMISFLATFIYGCSVNFLLFFFLDDAMLYFKKQ